MRVETAYYVVSSILKDETQDLDGKVFLIIDALKNGIESSLTEVHQNEEQFQHFDPSCFEQPGKNLG